MAADTRQLCRGAEEKQSASPDSAVFLSDPEEDRDDEPFDAPADRRPAAFACRGGVGLDARRLSLLKSLSQDSEYSLDSGAGALFGGAEAYLEELGFAGAAYPTIPDRFMPSLIERMADDPQLGGLNERILLSIGRFRRSLGKRRLFRQMSAGRPCPAAPPRRLCPDDAGRPLVRSNTGPSRYSDEKLPSEEVRRNSGISWSSSHDLPEGPPVVVAIRISDADMEDIPDHGADIRDHEAQGPSAPRDGGGSPSRDAEWTNDRDAQSANSGAGRESDGQRADTPSPQEALPSSALDSESDSPNESHTSSAPAGALGTDFRDALEQDTTHGDDEIANTASAVTIMTGKEGRVQDVQFDVNDVAKEHSAEVQPLHRTEKSDSVDGGHIDVSDSGSDRDLDLASRSNIPKNSSCAPVPTRRISLAKSSIVDTKLFSSWNSANRRRDVDSEVISNGKGSHFPFDEESSVPGVSPPAQPLPRGRQPKVPSRKISVAQKSLPGSPAVLSTVSPKSSRFTALLKDESGTSVNPTQPGLTAKIHVDSNTLKCIPPDNNNLSELKSPEIVKLLNRPFQSGKIEYTRSDSLTSFMSSMLHDNRPSAVRIPQPNESSFHTDITKDIFGKGPHGGVSDNEPARDEKLYDAAYRLETVDVLRVQSDHREVQQSRAALHDDGGTSETERPDDAGASDDRRSKEDPKEANRRKRPRLRRMSASLEQPDDPCDENAQGNSRSGSDKDSNTPADPVPLKGYADNHLQTVDARSAAPVPRRAFPEEVFHHCFHALPWDSRTSPGSTVPQEIPSDHGTDSFTFLSGSAGERHESPQSTNLSSVGLPKMTLSNDEKRDTKRLHDINELHCDSCRSSSVHLVPKLPDQATHHWDASPVLHPSSSLERKERVAFQRSIPTSSNSRSVGPRSWTETSASSSYDFFSFRKKFSETKDFDGMNRKSPLLRRACPAPSQAKPHDSSPEAVRALAEKGRRGAEVGPDHPRWATLDDLQDDLSRTELFASNRCLSDERLDVRSAHSHDLTDHAYAFPQRISREGHDEPSVLSPPRSAVASQLPSKQNDKSPGDEKRDDSETQEPTLGPRSPSQERLRDLLRQKFVKEVGGPPRPLERSDSASAEFVRSHRNPESRTETSYSYAEEGTPVKRPPNVHETGEESRAESHAPEDGERAGRTGHSRGRGGPTTGPASEEMEPNDMESDLSPNLDTSSLDLGAVPENMTPSPPESTPVHQGRSGRPRTRQGGSADGRREQLLERKMRIFAKLLSHLVFLIPGGEGAEGGGARASGALLRLLGLGDAPQPATPSEGGGAVVRQSVFGSGVRLAVNVEGGREKVFVSSVCMEVLPDSGRDPAAMWQQEHRRAEPVTTHPHEARGFRSASRELEELRSAIRKAKESRISASQELHLLQELLRSDDHPPPRSCPAEEDGNCSTAQGSPDSTALSDLRSKSKRDVLEDTRLFQEEVKKVRQETEEAWSARLERMESRLLLQEQELARLREENLRLSDAPPSPPPSSDPPSPTGRRSACCGRLSEQLSRAERRADELGLLLDQKLIELNKLQIALSAQTKEMIELEKSYVQLQCRLRRGAGKPSALGRLCARTFAPPRSPRPGV